MKVKMGTHLRRYHHLQPVDYDLMDEYKYWREIGKEPCLDDRLQVRLAEGAVYSRQILIDIFNIN